MIARTFTLLAITTATLAAVIPRDDPRPPTDDELFTSCTTSIPHVSYLAKAKECTIVDTPTHNADIRVWKTVGNAQQNCNGGTEDVSVTLGGSTSASETVENSTTAGFSLEGEGLGINAGTTFTHSSTTTSETDHSVTYQVPACRQAVFVAGYAMESVTANVEMTYNTRQAGHFDWFVLNATLLRPIADNIVYNVYESACGTNPTDLSSLSTTV